MTDSTVELINFEPEIWQGMNQHQKVESIFFKSDIDFKDFPFAKYLDTGDDETELLLEKIRAAKFAYKIVSKKMKADSSTDDNDDDDECFFDSDRSEGNDCAYNDNHLLKFASALQFNFTFDMCFKVKSETNRQFETCICPCTKHNAKWRQLF